ncbi:hypothetical protein LCGC14_3006550 [marine sediment metagenome]|uniref:Uncharacterized protein n=1 Tax=marine sediment metagenome TaxID=412755 RepID=A0A0F8ZQP5_9ZZZZ
MKQPLTPNCDKMLAVQKESSALTDFVDWLNQEKGYHICEWVEIEGYANPQLQYASYGGYSRLFADFFGIDYGELEREKRSILDYIRAHDAKS